MKARSSSLGNSSSYRQNSNRSLGKGVGSSFSNSSNKYNSNSSKSKSLYPIICRQWNFSTCSYGDKCKKFHVCWSCAEEGKLGEKHMASSHDTSSGKGTKWSQVSLECGSGTHQSSYCGDVSWTSADFIRAHEAVKESGRFNFEGCKIPIPTKIRYDRIREALEDKVSPKE